MASHLLQAYRCFILGFICLLSLSSSIPIGIVVTVEEPFIQQTTVKLDSFGIETFDGLQSGPYNSYHTDFNRSDYQGIYYDLQIKARDIYGGVGGKGSYPVATAWNPYRLVLTQDGMSGANYFGFWWSAIDAGNLMTFHYKRRRVFTLGALEILNLLQGRRDYWGNPTYDPRRHMEEPFAFVNVYLNTTRFDEVQFYQVLSYSCATDSHVVGYYTDAELVSTTTTASPVVKTTTASPVVKTTTTSPVVKTTTASPVVKTTTASPVVKTTTASPVVKTTTDSPVVKTTTTSSVVKTITVRPVVKTRTTSPFSTMMMVTASGPAPRLIIGAAAGGILCILSLVGVGMYLADHSGRNPPHALAIGEEVHGIQTEPEEREARIAHEGQNYA